MFEEMILSEPKGRKRRAVVLAFLGQVVAVGAIITIPLLFVPQLPLPDLSTVLIAPPPPPPPPPPAAPAAARVARTTPRAFDAKSVYQPHAVPKTVAVMAELPQAPSEPAASAIAGVEGGVTGGQIGGVFGGVLGGVPSVAPPPPPPPPDNTASVPPAIPKVIRVGGQVEAARVISAPPPVYPVLAKDAHVAGIVRLDAIIGTDGHIENLKVISGPPLLVNAAMAAVRQWTYHPTILNGQPFKVETQIDVNFTLG